MNQYIKQELIQTKRLLQLEKEVDEAAFQFEIDETTIHQQVKLGTSWFPVDVRESHFDFGERLMIHIQKRKGKQGASKFRSGDPVQIFASEAWYSQATHPLTGVINTVKERELIVTLNADTIPQWVQEGTIGVQQLFDSKSYKEMERAINMVIESDEEEIDRLRHVLLGDRAAEFKATTHTYNSQLNHSQNQALALVHDAQDVAIIHGPPGTGKTTTLVQAIRETVQREQQTLVCAPSNTAADLMVEKLHEQSINVLRLGHPARISSESLTHTLDYKLTQHPEYRTLRYYRLQMEQIHRDIGRFKRNLSDDDRRRKREKYFDAKQLKEEIEQLEFYIIASIIEHSETIVSTLVGASSHWLKGYKFQTIFIDEAAQALEPACWIPILKAKRVVFAGDHFQLPPTVKSQNAGQQGLNVTLFEKAIERNRADCMLRTQYRMNEKIMQFSSQYFYGHQLMADASVKHWEILPDDPIVEFIDTAGCGYNETYNQQSKSISNVEEAELLVQHIDDYLHLIHTLGWEEDIKDIGIISPYQAQISVLKKYLIKDQFIAKERMKNVNINTIDSFQGQERDVIYISLVRSNKKGVIGFLNDIRRMNVAMTRARKKLVIIGDTSTICKHPFYNAMLDYMTEIGAYRHAYEFLKQTGQ